MVQLWILICFNVGHNRTSQVDAFSHKYTCIRQKGGFSMITVAIDYNTEQYWDSSMTWFYFSCKVEWWQEAVETCSIILHNN